MQKLIRGNAYKFGNNVDTDQIFPGRYLELTDPEKIKLHAMEGADPTFAHRFQPGGIIVGGSNFGCGSSREHAVIALKAIGVAAIVAESFARIFFRNGINLGLPMVICKGIQSAVDEGDLLEVNLEQGVISNLTKHQTYQAERLSEFVLEIIEAGGIKALVRARVAGSQK